MFGGLVKAVPGTDTGDSVSEALDYYIMGAGRLAAHLRATEGEVRVGVLLSAEVRRISEILWARLGPTAFGVYSLDPQNLMLDALGERYEAYGLHRERQIFTAYHRGAPVAAATAEHSSLGANFSYFLNTYRIHILDDHLAGPVRREVFHKLLRALCAYYKAMGRDFVVGLCPPAHRDIYQELGYHPLKQYLSLAASGHLDSEAALRHLDGYYAGRLKPGRIER
jgi:hypothetical protein